MSTTEEQLREGVVHSLTRYRKYLNGPVPSDLLFGPADKEPFDVIVDEVVSLLSQHTQRATVENEQESVSRFVDAMFKEAKPIDQCYLAIRSFSDKYVAQLSTKDSTNKEDV